MTLQELRDKDIIQYLASRGYHPKRNTGNTAVYLSPFTKEHEPSFTVKKSKNRFHCYSSGNKGSVIDFVMAYDSVSFKEACDILKGGIGSQIEDYTPPKIEKKGVEIHSETTPQNKEVLSVLVDVRKIPYELILKYCIEIVISFPNGKNPDAKYTVIGMRNDCGGVDFRGKDSWLKLSSAPKSFTTVNGDKSKICLYEGFLDYLSHLAILGVDKPKYKSYILNGLGQLEVLKPFISKKEILAYLDNDRAADKAIASMEGMNVRDMRHEYAYYHDINDYLKDHFPIP